MSKQQPLANTNSAKSEYQRDAVDNLSPLSVERRTLLLGAAAVAAGALSTQASAAAQAPDLSGALAKFRAAIPSHFDRDYVENVVVPFYLLGVFAGERPILPMIDLPLSKQDAIPSDLLGMLYEDWKPTPSEGVTVFLEGLENRGDNNLRKRIYFTGVTPDLYAPKYQAKVVAFFDELLDPKHAGKPLMRRYLDYYWDIYWDLHLGVKGEAVPPQVRTLGESFNTVLAYRDPMQEIVYQNYMTVRALLPFLKKWIDARLDDVEKSRLADPDKTIAYYWLKNAGDGKYFAKKDVVFECFHNFVAFSQWGNSIFGVMTRLNENGGDPAVRAAFDKTMSRDFDNANGALHASRASGDGAIPHHLSQRRQLFHDHGHQGVVLLRGLSLRRVRRALRGATLHDHPSYRDELRYETLERPAAVRSGALQERPDQRGDR